MAGKELEVYDRIGDPMVAVKQLGSAIARSKMFGCENDSQGEVLALECLSRRMPPLSLADRFHIVEGKLMMRYDAMLAEFCRQGGEHEIISRTADVAEIKLTLKGKTLTERFTWEDAQKEPFPFGKDGKVKKNWATPRARRQMLWARCVSEAVRALCPAINHGKYTPEEMDYEEPASANGNGQAKVTMTAEEAMKAAAAKATATEGEPVDAEFVVVDEKAAQSSQATGPALCSADQRQRLGHLWDALEATDEQRAKQLAKRGVSKARDLTHEQASELIAKLEAAHSAKVAEVTGESTQTTAVQSVGVYEACGPQQVDAIKTLIKQSQDPKIAEAVKAHLVKHGKSKVAELSVADADVLKQCLTVKNLEAFFARSLQSPELATAESIAEKN